MTTNTITLGTYVVRSEDGTINHEASLMKFQSDLLNYEVERETETSVIGDAVSTVFDQFRGARLNLRALTSYTLTHLNAQPENFNALTERVQVYIRDNAGERETGALFSSIAKGKGGICRWTDYQEKTKS